MKAAALEAFSCCSPYCRPSEEPIQHHARLVDLPLSETMIALVVLLAVGVLIVVTLLLVLILVVVSQYHEVFLIHLMRE